MITSLKLTHFRNHTHYVLEDTAQPFVALYGDNGAGKTNILEAISLLSIGRGLRRAKPEHLKQNGHNEWAVSAKVLLRNEERQIGTGIHNNSPSRLIYMDGVKQKSQRALDGLLPMIWLTPQMDGLFQGAAGDRRRFIDRMTYNFFPSHANAVRHYEKVLAERNRLVKNRINNADWFQLLEQQMVEQAGLIYQNRLKSIALLEKYPNTDGFPAVRLRLSGQFSKQCTTNLERGLQLFQQDLQRNRWDPPRYGVHRDDVEATHIPKQIAAAFCSTGEQKALLISILLAQARALAETCHRPPVLLLDEVAAHLDATRRQLLYQEITNIGSQVWMTATSKIFFQDITGLIIEVV